MDRSKEYNTLVSCKDMLELALKGDRNILHFLENEGYELPDDVNNPRSATLTPHGKAELVVELIREKTMKNSRHYHMLMGYFATNKRTYKDIIDILDKKYRSLGVDTTDNVVRDDKDKGPIAKDETDGGGANKPMKETPIFTEEEERKLVRSKIPGKAPKKGTKEYEQLDNYRKEVKVILHTLNDNEYNAATTYLSPPNIEGSTFKYASVFHRIGIVLGMFAEKEVALIQTEQGIKIREDIEKAIKMYPNAIYIIGIGVCYAMDDQKYKLGDVLVSNKINDLDNCKYTESGEIEDRGQAINMIDPLLRIFCKNTDHHEPLLVASERNFKAFPGTLACMSQLINNLEMREKIKRAVPIAIGGEMEGGELLKFIGKGNIKGIIIIKGVADYGDGEKSKEWQFTAAMAAFKYAESKLLNVEDFEDSEDDDWA